MTPTEGRIEFDAYAVDLEARELSCDGRRVVLQEKPFRLLVALLERPGQVVARAALCDALWPAGVHVDREAGLNTAVRKLRAALRQASGGGCEPVETLTRVGYRLRASAARVVVPERAGASPPPQGAAPAPAPYRLRPSSRVLALALAGIVVIVVAAGLARLERKPQASPEPMPEGAELRGRYIEARSLLAAMGGDLSRAEALLRSLVEAAPEFAPAHAYLAEASARLAMRSAGQQDLAAARQAARRARQLDPRSAVAHRVQAMIALNFDWDVGVAGRRLARALELDPGDPVNHLAAAALRSALGRHEAAIAAVRRAVDLDPDSMSIRSDAGYFLLRAGRFREAAAECEMVLRLDVDNAFARECLLAAYSAGGDVDAARPQATALLQVAGAPDGEIEKARFAGDPRRVYLVWKLERLLARPDRPAVRIATCYAALGDVDGALTWLEVAARERDPLLIFVPMDAAFAAMRRQPRYREVLRRSGLGALSTDVS